MTLCVSDPSRCGAVLIWTVLALPYCHFARVCRDHSCCVVVLIFADFRRSWQRDLIIFTRPLEGPFYNDLARISWSALRGPYLKTMTNVYYSSVPQSYVNLYLGLSKDVLGLSCVKSGNNYG